MSVHSKFPQSDFSTTGVESWNRDMAVKGGRVLAFDGANAGHQRKSTRVEGVGSVDSPSLHVHLIQ